MVPKAVAHIDAFIENLEEVSALVRVHSKVAGAGPGRKHGVEVLNKSAIVFVVACWESFVEDIVKAALEFLIENASSHTVFPKPVLDRVSSKYQGPNAWNLAGVGWKTALRNNLSEILAKTTGTLNTPRAEQVNDLVEKALGLKNLSAKWQWPKRTSAQAIKALDDLITLRGSIAHRVKSARPVHRREVVSAIEFTSRLAAVTHNQIRSHIESLVGVDPWHSFSYKSTR